MTVLVAGGGIAGLTVALSLHQIGVRVRVFESVSELKPIGVGINVLPHAGRELIELGLAAGPRVVEDGKNAGRGHFAATTMISTL